MKIVLEVPVEVTDRDLKGILTTAFVGGINYWCRKYDRHGEFSFTLYDAESDDKWSFDKDDLIRGIKQYILNSNDWSILYTDDDGIHLEAGEIDADIADEIIQYACMGRVIFG